MQDVHFTERTMQRFLRAELSRQENAEVIRHILAQCPVCQETMRSAARLQGFELLEQEVEARDLPLAARLG